jgi:5-(hydroxymethyl)furfural/furfural oxidase
MNGAKATRARERRCDYLIVGGGSAGCVLANRLSASGTREVVLLEAGIDTPPTKVPADVMDVYPASYFNKAYMWPGLMAHWRGAQNSPAVSIDQARVMGGGSSVMGMLALRGTPDDYDEWEAGGAGGWSWQDVLPYFRKLETDFDFGGDLHGLEGPVPIRRTPRTAWPAFPQAAAEFAGSCGFSYIADMNADFGDGLCSQAMSNSPRGRASSAICYLDKETRARPNLTILPSTQADRLLFEGGRVCGVVANGPKGHVNMMAREVILSAGALHTPLLMLKSGIGPAAQLEKAGVTPHVNRAGVGQNLQNHPVLYIGVRLLPGFRHPHALRPHPTACIRASTGTDGTARSDIYVNIQSKSSWNALGVQVGVLAPTLLKPSSRGDVTLERAGHGQRHRIEFNFLNSNDDLDRMAQVFRLAAGLALSEPMHRISNFQFPILYSNSIRRLNRRSRVNAVRAFLLAQLMDLSPSLADAACKRLTRGCPDLATLLRDEELLREHLTRNVAGHFHPCGTCRMGPSTDPLAVVDSSGRVYDVPGLRVADASIMPSVPRGNTNIPTLMIGEKIADAILSGK